MKFEKKNKETSKGRRELDSRDCSGGGGGGLGWGSVGHGKGLG